VYGLPLFGLSETHLTAMGSVCVAWATLEQQLVFFIGELIPLENLPDRHVISGLVGVDPKVELARGFGRIRIEDDKKFQMVDDLLTFIGSHLRTRRNRAIHDLWIAGETAERLKIAPKFYKEPFKARRVEFWRSTPTTEDDVRKLANEIVIASNAISVAAMLYARDRDGAPQPWPDICAELNQIRSQTPAGS
jgi:hypothetical protein